eukprot:g7750.t1
MAEGKYGSGGSESEGKESDKPILYVMEDTAFDLECCTMLAEECGFEVEGFANWQDAEAAIARDEPDLVLMDYNQPGFDTQAFLQRMKGQVKVAAMSGDSDRDRIRQMLDGGLAARFIVKPVTMDDMQSLHDLC